MNNHIHEPIVQDSQWKKCQICGEIFPVTQVINPSFERIQLYYDFLTQQNTYQMLQNQDKNIMDLEYKLCFENE